MLCSSAFVNSRERFGKDSWLGNLAATTNLDLNFFGAGLEFQSKHLKQNQIDVNAYLI